MAEKKIAIIVDSPKRDLRGTALVAYELLKSGAEVYLVPMYVQGYDVPLLAPDAVIANYARTTNSDLLQTYRKLGTAVLVLDTEGGVLSESGSDAPENWAKLFFDSGLHTSVERYFFWGPRLREAFVAGSGLPSHALEITGCPRYDFCHKKWRDMLYYPISGYVLINTNFSAINPIFTKSANTELDLFKSVGWNDGYTRNLFSELEALFPRYLDTIERLITINPERTFVLRPHPFENPALYRRRFSHLKNVQLDEGEDVLNSISHADCMLHLNCGSAIETVLLNRTPISMEYLNSQTLRRHSPLPSEISCRADNFEDLNRLINDSAERARRQPPPHVADRHITPWFNHLDGGASRRVATSTLTLIGSKTGGRARRSFFSAVRGGRPRPSLLQAMQGIGSSALGSFFVSSLRATTIPARQAKSFDAGVISSLLLRLQACEGVELKVAVSNARDQGKKLATIALRLQE